MFDGLNKMYCSDCHSKEDILLQKRIDITPPVLIIVLDRGVNSMDFRENFEFEEILNLQDFVPNNNYTLYYLYGVIVHFGESGPSGHFIALCKMDIHSPWYSYNDSTVNECQDQRELFRKGTPYILFYHYYNN